MEKKMNQVYKKITKSILQSYEYEQPFVVYKAL